jgi:hypothetical protein
MHGFTQLQYIKPFKKSPICFNSWRIIMTEYIKSWFIDFEPLSLGNLYRV